jgi:uncharacterized protein (DUF1015 family)
VRVFAFQGVRFGSTHADPGRLAAPPYDQIDDKLRQDLQRDPHNFSHLSRPTPPEGVSPPTHAAELHKRWLQEKIIELDGEPALYPYEIQLAGGGRRLGLAALVGIEDPAAGVIRPHEQTLTKTVEERLDLLRTTETDLGPVLLLSQDEGKLEPLLSQDIAAGRPLAIHSDAEQNQHLLFRIENPERISEYRETLAPCPGLIADGHHRYEVARLYREETGAQGDIAAAAKLAVITSLTSTGLTIDPIHRALKQRIDSAQVSGIIQSRFSWKRSSGRAFAAAVAEAPQPALGVLGDRGEGEIWCLDATQGPRELPPAASELSVVLLHRNLFPTWGLSPSAATDGTVLYRSDAEVLFRALERGEATVGFWLPPMTPSGFSSAIARGDLLPPKSTRFLPKVVSGLVWASHESRTA